MKNKIIQVNQLDNQGGSHGIFFFNPYTLSFYQKILTGKNTCSTFPIKSISGNHVISKTFDPANDEEMEIDDLIDVIFKPGISYSHKIFLKNSYSITSLKDFFAWRAENFPDAIFGEHVSWLVNYITNLSYFVYGKDYNNFPDEMLVYFINIMKKNMDDICKKISGKYVVSYDEKIDKVIISSARETDYSSLTEAGINKIIDVFFPYDYLVKLLKKFVKKNIDKWEKIDVYEKAIYLFLCKYFYSNIKSNYITLKNNLNSNTTTETDHEKNMLDEIKNN